jgi:hypothetical protein
MPTRTAAIRSKRHRDGGAAQGRADQQRRDVPARCRLERRESLALVIVGFYEDGWGGEATLDRFTPTFIATRARRPPLSSAS